MKHAITFLLSVTALVFLCPARAMADSPLTSTPFGEAYIGQKGFPSIKKGDDFSLFKYLCDESAPVDYRLAAINLDGWDIDGKHRAEKFKVYLELEYGVQGLGEILTYCSPDILICYAYLKAMDDYFHVDESIAIAGKAYMDNPDSYTIFLFYTLLWAQKFVDDEDDWGILYVWPTVAWLSQERMEDHMLPEAEKIIFDYINEYKEYMRVRKVNNTI